MDVLACLHVCMYVCMCLSRNCTCMCSCVCTCLQMCMAVTIDAYIDVHAFICMCTCYCCRYFAVLASVHILLRLYVRAYLYASVMLIISYVAAVAVELQTSQEEAVVGHRIPGTGIFFADMASDGCNRRFYLRSSLSHRVANIVATVIPAAAVCIAASVTEVPSNSTL